MLKKEAEHFLQIGLDWIGLNARLSNDLRALTTCNLRNIFTTFAAGLIEWLEAVSKNARKLFLILET